MRPCPKQGFCGKNIYMKLLIKNAILQGKKADILVEGNKITKIAKNIDVKADNKIDCKGVKAIIPGLANMHTHSAMSLLRGYADDMPLKEWLETKIWPAEAKLTEDDIYWGTKLACLEMIKTGTTLFNDMYFFPEASAKAVQEMGIRALIGLVVFDFSPNGQPKAIEKKYQELKRLRSELINFAIAPHAIYTVNKENFRWAARFARKNNLMLHTHISETKNEVDECLKENKLRPAEYLDKLGAIGPKTILAHSVWLDDKEIKLIGKAKATVVNNPVSNLKLAVGEIFPYVKLRKAGANIAIGTDGDASNNNLDMFEEIKFASLMQKHKEKDATAMPSSQAFACASRNGYKALGMNGGEIKQGALADFCLVDLDSVAFMPGFNLESDIVYSANGDCITDVVCNGKILMRQGKIKDEALIKRKVKEIIKNKGL